MNVDLTRELARASLGPVTIDITTMGRRSGEPRRIEIWVVDINGRIIICGTPGSRDWLANVQADPAVTLHFKERAEFDVDATAHVVTDASVRREVWTHPATRWYRDQTPLAELVDDGPVIELVVE